MATPSSNSSYTSQPAIFISYKRDAYPDNDLAEALYTKLREIAGDRIFLDRQTIQPGDDWQNTIGERIRGSEYFIVILSPMAVTSDYIRDEVALASREAERNGGSRPLILPVTVGWKGPLPAPFEGLDRYQRMEWQSAADTKPLVEKFRAMVENYRLLKRRALADEQERLGEARAGEEHYVVRECDDAFYTQLARRGVTVTLVGSMQTGKTLLLERGKQKAREAGQQVIDVDLQLLEPEAAGADRVRFYQQFAATLRAKILDLNEPELQPAIPDISNTPGSPPDACTGWFAKNVLEVLSQQGMRILLTLDNLDAILLTPMAKDFISMLRQWHNLRFRKQWMTVGLVLVAYNHIFTYLQTSTPFNVGEEIVLGDFLPDHLSDLNRAYLPADPQDLGLLADLLGGHPYLTQVAFKSLAAKKEATPMTALARTACTEEGPFGYHLGVLRKHVFDHSLDSELRRVLKEARCAEDAFYKLQRYGLVRRESSAVKARCRLYAEYFNKVLEQR